MDQKNTRYHTLILELICALQIRLVQFPGCSPDLFSHALPLLNKRKKKKEKGIKDFWGVKTAVNSPCLVWKQLFCHPKQVQAKLSKVGSHCDSHIFLFKSEFLYTGTTSSNQSLVLIISLHGGRTTHLQFCTDF